MVNFNTDVVIGLEIHLELATKSKLFCGCKRSKDANPNTNVCPVCLGHPGSKPVLNKRAVEYALKLAIALGFEIDKQLIFSRKSYFYPDLAKNYQITQYERPLGKNGKLKLSSGRIINITRVHIEEDPASLVHTSGIGSPVLIDYNRSGDPLAEIVTEPELKSAEEARDFMNALISLVNYLEIFDVDTCIIKADANVSIKESNYMRVEIKNITGFKDIERALNYEIERQRALVAESKPIINETRGWDSDKGITYSLRSKETEDDYGYILDPDLPIMDLSEELIDKIKAEIPELPQEKAERFIKELKLKEDDAHIIAKDKIIADMFEEVIKSVDSLLAAKWFRRELLRVMNYNKIESKHLKIRVEHLVSLLNLISQKRITDKVGQKIIEESVIKDFDVVEYVKKNNLEQIQDSSLIESFCREAIAENSKAVEELKAGNAKSLNFLVGQVMRKSKGKAAPQEVNALIRKILGL